MPPAARGGHALLSGKRCCGTDERQRRSVLQPRVARNELPWVVVQNESNRNAVVAYSLSRRLRHRHNLVEVVPNPSRSPRVGVPASRQPWAGGCNAVGVGEASPRRPFEKCMTLLTPRHPPLATRCARHFVAFTSMMSCGALS